MKNTILLLILTLSAALLTGCNRVETKYHIGVSQCSGGYWRNKLNNEMRRELLLHDSTPSGGMKVDMELLCSEDNCDQQIRDIQHFIDEKVDMIICSPGLEEQLTPVISKAYKAGIPVLLFDRFVKGDDYTAFVGGDNIDVGEQLAYFTTSRLPNGGNIVELMGNLGTSPARLRHEGLMKSLAARPDIHILASVDVGWDGPLARNTMDSLLALYPDIDIVVAHTDFMAGAAKASVDSLCPDSKIRFVGADGFGVPGLGIFAVAKSRIDGTAIYPTGGDVIMQTALDILEGKPYQRETLLPSTLVTDPKDARLMVMLNDELNHEVSTIQRLRDRIGFYIHQLTLERSVLISLIVVLLLAVCVLLLFIRVKAMAKKNSEQKQEIAQKQEVIEQKEEEIELQKEEISNIKEKLEMLSELDREFVEKVKMLVDENIGNPDFGVEQLAAEVCLSRSQLYRKCKALTGESPMDMLKNARMTKAHELLVKGNLSVTEVAREIGMTNFSYFTRCYKSVYGVLPKDETK